MIPNSNSFALLNATIPQALLVPTSQKPGQSQLAVADSNDGLVSVDLEIVEGVISNIVIAGSLNPSTTAIDLRGGMVMPCFVDIHTHLDKSHSWERSPNPDGTFANAVQTIRADAEKNWTAEDLYRRMEFGLKCSYAHGTKALRTHLDSFGDHQAAQSFDVFQALQVEWHDRLTLQAVSLVSLDYYLTPAGERLADRVAAVGGVLGGIGYMNPEIEQQVDRVFALAKERNLSLDFHTDENGDPNSKTLNVIAEATLRYQYFGRVVCGHCCSLAMQDPDEAEKTIALVKQAQLGIVSLPMCNLYLQDRQPGRTPRWRGITLLHELKQAGVPVIISSDNCRDPFYGFGDHDALEVLSLSTKIAHLDRPYSDWCRAITMTPADLMGLPMAGRIGVGLPADLILFRARRYSELFARPQSDRTVLRAGQPIDRTLPDYAELDDLMQKGG